MSGATRNGAPRAFCVPAMVYGDGRVAHTSRRVRAEGEVRLIVEDATRLMATRLLNELQNECGADVTRAFPDNPEHGVVFAVLLREAFKRAPTDAEDRKPPSINGLATSLGRPFETIRRYAHALEARGLVRLTPGGIVLTADAFTDPAIAALTRSLVARFRFFLAELARAGLLLDDGGRTDAPSPGECLMAALDLYLCALEFNGPEMRSWIELLIIGAVLVINIRPIARNLTLSRHFGAIDRAPPLEVRRPASALAVAEQTGLPASTVRRHLKRATEAGLLIRDDTGYVLSTEFLSADDVRSNAARIMRYLRRVMGDLGSGAYRTGEAAFDAARTGA